MVVVSHLFFFFIKKFGRGTTHLSLSSPCLEPPISRQPLDYLLARTDLAISFSDYLVEHFPFFGYKGNPVDNCKKR